MSLERPPTAIGKNTITAMQSGILFGYVGLVEGLVERFRQELGGKVKVVATGWRISGIGDNGVPEVQLLLTREGIGFQWSKRRSRLSEHCAGHKQDCS